jgi:phosphatidylglycerol---prolipoprotein diacylglyceryl transferase
MRGRGARPPSMNSHLIWHNAFEVLAWLSAIGLGLWGRRRYFADSVLPIPAKDYPAYMVIVWVGAVVGAFGLGTLNLQLENTVWAGRSILGAIVGGVLVAETYKAIRGIRGSTGAVFVLPLSVAIAVGRIGCFLGGLDDHTYGIATTLPWGVDFGDGIARHPVQLYESFTMAAFALWFLWLLNRHRELAVRRGFYFFALVYGGSRFLWEFLKPYPTVIGPLNIFHLSAAALAIYAVIMLTRVERQYARP